MYSPYPCRLAKSDHKTFGYVYDSQGEKVGSIMNDRIYDVNGHYVGGVMNERIYDAHGNRVGKVISSHLYDAQDQKVGYFGGNGYAYDQSGQEVGQVLLTSPNRTLGGATAILLLLSSKHNER